MPAKKIFAAAQSSPTARACCGAKRSPTKASTRFARVDAAVATGTLEVPGGGFDPDTMDDSFDRKMLMPPMKHSCKSARVLKLSLSLSLLLLSTQHCRGARCGEGARRCELA